MPGKHSAENCKLAIETIVNFFDFNKSKITAVVTDEGSNLLRLFKQLDNGKPLYIYKSRNEQNLDHAHFGYDDDEGEIFDADLNDDEGEELIEDNGSKENTVYMRFENKPLKVENELKTDVEVVIIQEPLGQFDERQEYIVEGL